MFFYHKKKVNKGKWLDLWTLSQFDFFWLFILDVLLQDLEATIPDAITPEAKSPKQQTIESFDVS